VDVRQLQAAQSEPHSPDGDILTGKMIGTDEFGTVVGLDLEDPAVVIARMKSQGQVDSWGVMKTSHAPGWQRIKGRVGSRSPKLPPRDVAENASPDPAASENDRKMRELLSAGGHPGAGRAGSVGGVYIKPGTHGESLSVSNTNPSVSVSQSTSPSPSIDQLY
jgi:hypothetical protein